MKVLMLDHFKKYWLVLLLVSSIGVSCTYSQDQFVFRNFDNTILELWLEDSETLDSQSRSLSNLSHEWNLVKRKISSIQIPHFDNEGFVASQDQRMSDIVRLINYKKIGSAKKEVYFFITEFKDVRECFTNDDYGLDQLLIAYDSYRSVHGIIHDQQMGLYEWREFIWYIDQLKRDVKVLERRFDIDNLTLVNGDLKESLDRLNTCLHTLDESLGDAYRPDFEIPCDELHDAFKSLFRAYMKKNIV